MAIGIYSQGLNDIFLQIYKKKLARKREKEILTSKMHKLGRGIYCKGSRAYMRIKYSLGFFFNTAHNLFLFLPLFLKHYFSFRFFLRVQVKCKGKQL